jgi:thymidylate kinase
MTSTSRIERVPVTPTDLLGRLFFDLSLSEVDYAVTRNYEQLPHSVGARDLDIVLIPAHRRMAVQVVARLAKEFGYQFAKFYTDEKLTQLVLAKRTSAGLAELQIDFFTSCQIYGIEFLSAAEMLKDLRWHNGIPVVSQPVVLLDKLLFHLAVGKPLHPKYDLMFAGIAGRTRTALLDKLIPLLGDKEGRQIVNEIRAGRASALPPLSAVQWLSMLVSAWKTQRAGAYLLLPKFMFHRLRDRVKPSGFWLSVSGPDGAGKTTVIELVLADLALAFGKNGLAHRGHFRPSVLPRIAELAAATGATKTVDVDYSSPHRSAPSGVLGSLFRLSYYVADYIHGYFRVVRPALIDRRIVLFDRYYHDVIADPRRSRIRLPGWLLRAFALLVPLPRYSFFISVRPEVGHQRKQELTLGQIEQLNLAYGDLVRRGFMTEVPNNGLAAEAAAAIVDHIFADRDKAARSKMQVVSR